MMKKQNKKRGFTIVELTIVVSVIAILSAVLIPTFAGVIKRSKISADEQAVRNMNTVIATITDENLDYNLTDNEDQGEYRGELIFPDTPKKSFYHFGFPFCRMAKFIVLYIILKIN